MNKIILGDCIEEMKKLESNSVDAIITDPPYGLEFMGKEWDKFKEGKNIAGGTTGLNTPFGRSKALPSFFQLSKGKPKLSNRWQQAGKPSMEKFDGHNDWHSQPRPRMINDLDSMNTLQDFCFSWASECLRVLKPGGFLLSMGGTRTYHRLVCGIEDAGFEIRDTIMWLYGSGFPKSLNIGKQIDKLQGNERKVVGEKIRGDVQKAKEKGAGYLSDPANRNNTKQFGYGKEEITKGNSEWEGWGTALKPACEPIVVARKPLSEKNVALNVLKWGTGGINIDECRIGTDKSDKNWRVNPSVRNKETEKHLYGDYGEHNTYNLKEQGRFPANILFSCFCNKMRLKKNITFKIKKEIEEYYAKKS